jgi:hypothetical protein
MFRLFKSRITPTDEINFREQGFVLLAGLIPPPTVIRARDAMGIAVSNNASPSRHVVLKDAAVLDCFTQPLRSAAGTLGKFPYRPLKPRSVYTITVFPTSPPWQSPPAHIDHSNPEDAHRTFPLPYRVGCLIYLNDVPAESGATVVWPGSHRILEAIAREHPQDYEYLHRLNQGISSLDLGSPAQITAAAGDVLFYHPLCAHSGSPNTGTAPRFALNHKW